MSQRGLDIRDHRSRTVTAEMLESSDLILTMETGHKEALQVEFPSLSEPDFTAQRNGRNRRSDRGSLWSAN